MTASERREGGPLREPTDVDALADAIWALDEQERAYLAQRLAWTPDAPHEVLAATPAPREHGWQELRREIEALQRTAGFIDRAAVLAIVDRLAAARGEPPEPGPAIDVDSDAFRDDHERAIRAHILEGPEDHRCDDLCSAAIIDRLVGKHPINEYPSRAALRDKP